MPELSVDQQLLECEEALRCARAEAEKWMEMVVDPIKTATGLSSRAVHSLSWDELLGVANRNIGLGLDAVACIEQIAHNDTGHAGEIAHEWLVKQGIWRDSESTTLERSKRTDER